MKVTLDTTDKPERKKRAPRTAFKPGNPYAFRPGESGRSRQKTPAQPDDVRLVSRALRARLPFRAPDAIAVRFGLEAGASWAQVVAQSLLFTAVKGDVQAVRAIHELSEGMRQRIAFGFDADDNGENAGGQRLQVNFISARYGGGDPSHGPKLIDTDAEGNQRIFQGDTLIEMRPARRLTMPDEIAPEGHKPEPERASEQAAAPKPGKQVQPKPAPSRQEVRLEAYRRSGLKI